MRPCRRTPSCSKANGSSGAVPSSAATRAPSSGAAVGLHEAADPLELLVGHGRVAGAHGGLEILGHGRRAEVDPLEQRVHGVADLGRREPRLPRHGAHRVGGPQPDHALGEVAVRAALEERERAVGEPAHSMERRGRNLGQRREHRRLRRRAAVLGDLEELQLLHDGGCAFDERLRRVPVEPDQQARASALDLHRPGSAPTSSNSLASSRSSTQPIGVFASALRSWSIAPETISRSIARVIAT